MTDNPLIGRMSTAPGRVTVQDLQAMADSLNAKPWAIDYGWHWRVVERNGRAILTRADGGVQPKTPSPSGAAR